MDARRNPDYLRKLIDDVKSFRAAFDAYLALHVVANAEDSLGTPGLVAGISPAAVRRDDVAAEQIQQAADHVARTAG